MATGDEVILPISVDASPANAGLKSFENASTRAADVFKGVLGAKAVEAVVQAAGKALSAFAGFFGDGIESAKKQEDALKNLEIQLGLSGEASQATLDDFSKFADEMESSTLIADDLVLKQAALAKSFGLTNEQAKDLVRASAELSAVTGDSLETSVKELGKTYTGVAGRSVTLKAATEGLTAAQLKNGDAVKIVMEQFGGAAAARIDTFSGKLQAYHDEWGNLSEAIAESVVQSDAVKESLTVFTEVLTTLKNEVTANKDSIDDWIKNGIAASGAAILVAIDVVEVFVQGINAIAIAMQAMAAAVVGAAALFTRAIAESFGSTGKSIIVLLEMLGVVEKGTSAAFQAMSDSVVKSVDDVADSLLGMTVDSVNRAKAMDDSFQAASKAVDGSTTRILTANKKEEGSLNSLQTKRRAAADAGAADAKKVAKAVEDAAKLEAEIYKASTSDIQKALSARDEFAKKIDAQLAARIISTEKAAELELKIESDLVLALENIRQAADEKAIADAKLRSEAIEKEAADARKRVEEIAADPIKFILSADKITASDIAPLAVGLTSAALDGAKGAQKILSQGIGAAGDAIIPGIGGAVSGLVDQLAKGPEENKKMIQEFVEAFPQLITAINESIPAIVETLITELIEKGGIVRIAVALVKSSVKVFTSLASVVSHAIFGNIQEFLGPAFDDGVRKLVAGITTGVAKIGQFFATIGQFILPPFETAGQTLINAIGTGAQSIFGAVTSAFGNIAQPILDAVRNAFMTVFNADKMIRTAVLDAFSAIKIPVPEVFNTFISAIKSLFTAPGWLQSFIDTIRSFTDFKLPSIGGSSSKKGPVTGIKGSPFASGGMIPAGFPDDTFNARLTSFERVVNVEENRDLTGFLSDYNAGRLMNEAQNGGFDREALGILQDIAVLLARADGRPVVVELDKRELARGNLGNSRLNARTA